MSADFESWLAALRSAAAQRDAAWLVGDAPASYKPAFEAGRSPEDEIRELLDLAEWRGCGCGGG